MLDNFCDENTVIITCGESKVPRMSFLGELYPFPNIYRGTDRNHVTAFGRQFAKQAQSPLDYFFQKPLWKELFRNTLSTALQDTYLHPIVYAAGVLFNNNKIVTIAQHNGMEYGTSLDAVSRLTPFLERQLKKGNQAVVILHCDQFGILHAPCSVARAYLYEKSFGTIQIVVHTKEGELRQKSVSDLVPHSPKSEELLKVSSKL